MLIWRMCQNRENRENGWIPRISDKWQLTKRAFTINERLLAKLQINIFWVLFRTSNYFLFCSKYDGKNIFEINPLASNDVNSLSVELSSLYSLRSPSKWSKFQEFRLREFVYFSVRNHSVGDWRGEKTKTQESLVIIDHTNFAETMDLFLRDCQRRLYCLDSWFYF